MRPALVVPTLGNRERTLWPLLRDAGMPAVVVLTGERMPERYPQGTIFRTDYDEPPNIHRWWNEGIETAVQRLRAEVVVVTNDDVEAPPGALLTLAEAVADGAALAYVDPPWAPRVTPITGWCFAVNPALVRRADERYQWWWGEHDLELRTRRRGLPVKAVRCGARHLRQDGRYDRSDLNHDHPEDRELFMSEWPPQVIEELLGQ